MTDEQIDALEYELTRWAEEQRQSALERDRLVRVAVTAGISKHRVHVLTGLARTTIDSILSREGGEE